MMTENNQKPDLNSDPSLECVVNKELGDANDIRVNISQLTHSRESERKSKFVPKQPKRKQACISRQAINLLPDHCTITAVQSPRQTLSFEEDQDGKPTGGTRFFKTRYDNRRNIVINSADVDVINNIQVKLA
jgi:hypothetical protein